MPSFKDAERRAAERRAAESRSSMLPDPFKVDAFFARRRQSSAPRDTKDRSDAEIVERNLARMKIWQSLKDFSRHPENTPDEPLTVGENKLEDGNDRHNETTRHSSSMDSTPRSNIAQAGRVEPESPRPPMFKRMPSEPRDRLLETHLGPERKRAASPDVNPFNVDDSSRQGIKGRSFHQQLVGVGDPYTKPSSQEATTKLSTTTSKHKSRPARGIDSNPETYGWGHEHLVLRSADQEILQVINLLGKGSLGFVEEVRCMNSQLPTFVRKRVIFPPSKRQAVSHLLIVQEEAKILRSLVHPHIVSLLGSYEDNLKSSRRPSYCLLMAPVGENDLEAFLAITGDFGVASAESIQWRECIRNWMCCLASALRYMHASGIRHQDTKPSNIIHKGNKVFFTDFSSSATFRVGHTTSTENPARSTRMYSAPEVTSDQGKHGRTTDIFALGCVFSDILSVAEGRTVHDFQDFLRHEDKLPVLDIGRPHQALSYSEEVPRINEWFNESSVFNACVSPMLHADRRRRPAAAEVLQSLVLHNHVNRDCECTRDGFS